jgi:anti-sigma regulatory factor (Ser/Thr protein kinase)
MPSVPWIRRHCRGELPREPRVRVEFGRSTDVPARARAAIVEGLRDEPRRDDLTLAASELVTNVLRHTTAGGALEVYDGDVVVMAVHDADPAPPLERESGPHGGFGIGIVSAIADAWGTECSDNGKTVWAVFRRFG